MQETLTGFKWMASKAHDAINAGMKFIFAFEEAIGKFLNIILFTEVCQLFGNTPLLVFTCDL